MSAPRISILIPTRGRPSYLDVTLSSVAPQARTLGAEIIVVDDGQDPATAAVAARRGARRLPVGPPSAGANAARNAGIEAASGELIVLIDDDVRAPAGWLGELLEGARRAPDHEVFGGPIRADLEGGGPRSCGRERPSITTLDLGLDDQDAELVWSANMAIRRSALDRVGPFDESILGRGEEEDWERRYAAAGGRIRYLGRAGLEHRRTRTDASLRRLVPAEYALGQSARRYAVRIGDPPPAGAEAALLARCLTHIVRFRCPNGLVVAAHAAGRLREAIRR